MSNSRRVIFIGLDEGRAPELEALAERFDVRAYRKMIGSEEPHDFVFAGEELDSFLAGLRDAGFDFEEGESWS